MTDANTEKRCAVIAVLGAPNAGKSTLVNRLVGAKVSIVTQKVQTTRARIRGVAVDGAVQLVFIDTPGIFSADGKRKSRALDRAMMKAAWDAIDGADEVVLIVDAPAFHRAETAPERSAEGRARADTLRIISGLKDAGARAVLALNKIDEMARQKLLGVVGSLNETGDFSETFLISAKTGDGVGDLASRLKRQAPPGPWLYPDDQLSDISDRLMSAEVTREKIFLRLHQEIPYDATVETEQWKETETDVRIEQTIYVARDGQKGIMLGKNGQTLKTIGSEAREELAEILGKTVHLFLHVKVREGWADERARLAQIGLDPAG